LALGFVEWINPDGTSESWLLLTLFIRDRGTSQ